MIRNNIFNKYIQNLKYIKNKFIIKCNVIKKKKKNGEKITFSNILNEFNITYNKKHTKNTSYNNSSKSKEITKKSKSNANEQLGITLKNVFTATSLIIVSLGFSFLIFEKSNNISFLKITEESEIKILNTLKSPKTNVYIKPFYIEEEDEVSYYADVVDNLDYYSYKINLDDISDNLKGELLLSNYKDTTTIKSLDNLNASSVIEYENKYLIDNKYNIDKNKLNEYNLGKLNSSVKMEAINSFNNLKMLIISSTTLILSLISNSLYFYAKKVISKK